MKRTPKAKAKVVIHGMMEPPAAVAASDVPNSEAFLEEAKSEPKRKLILDHVKTIKVLRDEKNFTFSAIADWFMKKGFQTDRSAVYRAYLLAVPKEQRDPNDQDWQEMEPD
jgi:hypothetical protein